MRILATFALHSLQILYPVFIVYLTAHVLTQSLGSEVVFFFSIGSLMLVLLEYGFQFSGSRRLALMLGDKERVSSLLSSILGAQLLFGVITTLIVLITAIVEAPKIGVTTALLAVLFQMVHGILPTWVFIVLSLQVEFLLVTILLRLAGAALALMLVSQHQLALFFLVQLAISLGLNGAGLALLWKKKYFRLRYSQALVLAMVREGFDVFLMKAGIYLYTGAGTVVLGAVRSPDIVGSFGLSQRFINALQQGSAPLFMSALPLAARFFGGDTALLPRLHKLCGSALAVAAGITVTVLLFGASAMHLLGLARYSGIGACTTAMAPIPFFVAMSTIFGQDMLIASGRDAIVRQGTLVIGGIGILCYFVAGRLYGALGVSVTLCAIEFCVALMFGLACSRYGLLQKFAALDNVTQLIKRTRRQIV